VFGRVTVTLGSEHDVGSEQGSEGFSKPGAYAVDFDVQLLE
jgi:hypothetical protein